MKTAIVTAPLNTTIVRRGQTKEVELTPLVKELIAAGILYDVTPKPPPKKSKPKPQPEEETDDVPGDG